MKNLQALTAFLFVFFAMVASQSTQAAYVATPAIEGLNAGTYKPLTMPNLTGSNFAATGKIWVNGRYVTIPGYLPPASTAASAAKNSLWANPWLLGAALLGWAGDAGLGSDAGVWNLAYAPVSTEPQPGEGTVTGYAIFNGPLASSKEGACLAIGGAFNYMNDACTISQATCYSVGFTSCTEPQIVFAGPVERPAPGTCASGYTLASDGSTCNLTDAGAAAKVNRAATLADFQALPVPPVQALAELAPQVGVPVGSPVFEPGDIIIGSPYTSADGSTFQPMAKITPQPAGDVMVDTYDLPLTSSTGEPIANPTPQDTTDAAPTENQCDKYPATLGCARLDIPESENLSAEVRDIALISPVAIGGAGSCPAPLSASFLGRTVEMSFDPLCQFSNSLRPVVLVLAWLAAGVIFIGGVRS